MSSDIFSTRRNKRPAESLEPAVPPQYMSRALYPTIPNVIRRINYRQQNVAAKVWGRQLPSEDNRPGQPSYAYKAILRHRNLFFQFAIRLPIDTLVDLYAIDKEFHLRFNKYSISIIHDHAKHHAPLAAHIFSWSMFPDLCISDPMARPMDGRPHLARDIPSLRWTKMVLHRDRTVGNILTQLALEGHRVPRAVRAILMKFWLLMEMKTMAPRTAFLADKEVWPDAHLVLFHLLLVKLDMRCTHPVFGHGMGGLSHLLLSQKSLRPLHNVLMGHTTLDYEDVADMLVRTYNMADLDTATHPWLLDDLANGVLSEQWGTLSRENWDEDGAPLDAAVDMVIMEALRRGLHPQKHLLDFVTYGYVEEDPEGQDIEDLKNVIVPRKWRCDEVGVHVNPRGEVWPAGQPREDMIERWEKRIGHVEKGMGPMKDVRLTMKDRTSGQLYSAYKTALIIDEESDSEEKGDKMDDGGMDSGDSDDDEFDDGEEMDMAEG